MGRGFRKFYTSVVTIGLAGVLAIGAYKWDNIKPALTTTSQIYTESDLQAREESVQKDYENQIAESNAKVEELEAQLEGFQSEKLDLTTQINSLTSEKTQLQTQVDSLSADKKNLQNEVNTLTTEKSQLESDINSKQTRITELETNITSLSSQISEKDTKISELEAEVETLKSQGGDNSEVEALEAEIETLKTEKANLQTQVDSLTSEKTQLQEDIANKQTRITQLETEVSEKANSIQQLETEVSEKQTRITELETQVSEKNTRISELEAQVEELQNQGSASSGEPVLALFSSNDEILEGQALLSGDCASEPTEIPTRKGYTFLGWSKDGRTVCNVSEIPLTQNTEFVALWEAPIVFAGMTLNELLLGEYLYLEDGELSANATTFTSLGNSDFVIPPEATSIADNGFQRCSNITSLNFSISNVAKIGSFAFSNISNSISYIQFNETLREIGDSAFYNSTTTVQELFIPEGVKTIGSKAFYSALNNVRKLSIATTVKEIGTQAFNKVGSTSTSCNIYLPSSVETISATTATMAPFASASTSTCSIYTDAQEGSIPSGWSSYWNYSKSSSVIPTTYNYSYENFLSL